MSVETFNEFWAAKCKKNPNLLDPGTIKLSMKVFKLELERAFIAGTMIPAEMARIVASSKRKPKDGNGLRNINDLIRATKDEESMIRAGKAHSIVENLGINQMIIFESRPFAESIIAFIVGDISEDIFTNICKVQKQGLS